MAPAVPIVYTGQKESKGLSQKSSVKMTGKSRKFSIGHAGGLMPDYRHPVEITAESEGFGSSGRVDTEMTLSENSCSPKRKCISLNGDSHDRFSVPLQVLSCSKLSKSERRDLEIRLKRELEEVRIMQRRVASFSMSAVVLSPFSDIHSCSDGQKRPPMGNTQRLPEHPAQGKKRLPQGRNGPRSKKIPPTLNDPPKQPAVPINNSNPILMKQCENLLNRLMTHQFGWVFNKPVDVVELKIPDYYNVIKHPMDLGTVKSKFSRGEYSCPLVFAADVRLAFSNAMTYNPPGNDVHFMAQTLGKHFEQRWKAIEKKIPANTDVQVLSSRTEVHVPNGQATDAIRPTKKKKDGPVSHTGKAEPVKRVMSVQDKRKLSMELESLLGELPESIIEFLKENSSGAEQTSEDEIEIDIDALSDDVLFKLRKLLDDFLLDKKKHQTKAELCELELRNESGVSNSSMQPGKGNDAVDEDVDIGGDDHPVSSFPPVEIEKDTANKNSRCSSPSSSSSDSDSDSGSSSSSESEGGKKALPQANELQGTMNARTQLDRSRIEVDQDVGRNLSQDGLSQVAQNQAVEKDDHKEGESALSERQVSPDKLYRAALLRSRFADTIFKAREKTLDDKGEKRDPEKVRLEREELERRQREEKARLQAEAKAAEEARKKAEAEAAAEAKRKRELEREAARLALQKMEKTVDINESSQFMEDLEMLRAAPVDNLTSFMDNMSPHDSQDDAGGLGSFRFRADSSNPLEQLGLYMKDDCEDEEEVEAPQSEATDVDVEAPDSAANNVDVEAPDSAANYVDVKAPDSAANDVDVEALNPAENTVDVASLDPTANNVESPDPTANNVDVKVTDPANDVVEAPDPAANNVDVVEEGEID